MKHSRGDKVIIKDVTDERKCCCSCNHNIRTWKDARCICTCDKDGHRIGYVENFEKVCDEWNTGRERRAVNAKIC